MKTVYQTREVVTCENCKHWRPENEAGSRTLGTTVCVCAMMSWDELYYTRPDDFCSAGDLKGEDE